MHTLSPQVKGRRTVLAALYVVSSLWWGPAAEAAFHLERADGHRPTNGIAHQEIVWDSWKLPAPRKPVQVRSVQPAAPQPASGGSMGPMTNRFVRSGCEARHAQQWSPSGRYWGKYQFDRQTWGAHGGDPAKYGSASEKEQDAAASRVRYDAWPNC